MTPEGLQRAAEFLHTSGRVLVSTGAGMSKESGIPTFRDAQEGLWARFDPAELATEEGFRAAPARVWSWYEHRRHRMRRCRPHAGHAALVELARLVPLTIVTQNIDGLHQRSGSSDVIELHGSIHRNRCIDCGAPGEVETRDGEGVSEVDPPRCASCGSWLRPDVVWFGELLPVEATERAWALAAECDTLLVVGTSGVVWPAAELPRVTRRNGGRVVEVNPEPSELTRLADVYLEGVAGVVLPRLAEAVANLSNRDG